MQTRFLVLTVLCVVAVLAGPIGALLRASVTAARLHARASSSRVYSRGIVRDLRRALRLELSPFLAGAETGGIAWELLTGFVTAPSSTQTALTMGTGDTLQVRATPGDKLVELVQLWTDQQAAGILRVKSPNLHDNVQGIRIKSSISDTAPLLPWGRPQRLRPTDVLSVDLSGSATAGDIETAALLLYYEDLPGISGQFITWDEVMKRGVNHLTVENTLSLGTAGGWSGAEAINAEYDLYKADTKYALIGYVVDVECAAVAWKGADTGNLRVGGPGNETLKHVTAEWFKRLSIGYNRAAIPVFNSLNKSGISIDGAQDENGADPLVTAFFVELAPRG